MIKVDLLKNHPESLTRLIEIWYEGIAKIWLPGSCISQAKDKLNDHLNEDSLPLTFVALEEDQPVGMCSLRVNDGIQPDLTPWLGSLVVDPTYQKRGIGKILIETTKKKAKDLGFKKLYLFAFDPTIPEYYTCLGWKTIGTDKFKTHPVTVMEVGL